MEKKVFGKGYFSCVVVYEGFIDNDTYILIFEEKKDEDGNLVHLEVEYHLDTKEFTYENVWDYDHKVTKVPSNLKEEIEEYIVTKCGYVKGIYYKHKIEVEVTLDIDPETSTVGEVDEFLKNIEVEALKYPKASNIKVIGFKRLRKSYNALKRDFNNNSITLIN